MDLLEEAPQIIRGWRDVRFHLYSSEVVGRLRPLTPSALAPGGEAIVEIRLAAPVAAARHDRFVIRRPSPATTLGGGEVLDPEWPRLRGARLQPALAALSGSDAGAILHWVAAAGESGATVADLARRLGSAHSPVLDVLEQAARAGSLRLAKGSAAGQDRWIAAAVFERVARARPRHPRRVLPPRSAGDRACRRPRSCAACCRLRRRRWRRSIWAGSPNGRSCRWAPTW